LATQSRFAHLHTSPVSPPPFQLKLNGKLISQLSEEANYSYDALYGLDISAYATPGRNTVEFCIAPPVSLYLQFHCTLVEHPSSAELFEQTVANQTRSRDECLAFLRTILLPQKENTLFVLGLERPAAASAGAAAAAAAKQRVEASVLDPYSLTPMNAPMRSVHCTTHAQCFDLSSHLSTNRVQPSFRCPCCGASARLIELYQDVLARGAIESYGQRVATADGNCAVSAAAAEEAEEDEAPCSKYYLFADGTVHFDDARVSIPLCRASRE
jgi:MIZ/SP-RING zinc finger